MQLQGTETTWYLMGDLGASAAQATVGGDSVADHAEVLPPDTLVLTPAQRPGTALDVAQADDWQVKAGRAYRLRVPVHPNLPRAHGEIYLQWLDANQVVIGQVAGPFVFLEHGWAERSLWAVAPDDAVRARFLLRFLTDRPEATGCLEVRRARLEPSLLLEARSSDPVALYDADQGGIGYTVMVRGASPSLEGVAVAACVRGYDRAEEPAFEARVWVPLRDGVGRVSLEIPPQSPGYYALQLGSAPTDGLVASEAEASFGCLGPLEIEPSADSAIALDAGMSWPFEPGRTSVDGTFDEERLRQKCEACYRLGLRSLRDRLNWDEVNPEPGVFRWGKYAIAAKAQAQAGLDVYQVFHNTAGWATVPTVDGAERHNLPPADPRDLYRMTRQLARDLAAEVSFFELWNEPDIQFFSGYVWDYAGIVKAGYLGIKDERPEMGVLWGSRCQRTEFWAKVLANGCGAYWDIFNQHSYGEPEDLWELHRQDRELMASAGVQRPIWMTEMGRRAVPDADGSYVAGEREQVSYLLRAYGCGLVSGLDRFYYFYLQEFLEAGARLWGLMRADLSPKPAFVALGALIRQLGAAVPLGYLRQDRTYCLAFQRLAGRGDGDAVGLAWSLDGTPLTVMCRDGAYLVNGVGTRIRDLPPGETTLLLDEQPVFIRGLRPDDLALRAASPRPRYAPDSAPPTDALHLWLQAVSRPHQPYPDSQDVARHKLALETSEGVLETVDWRIHNWTASTVEVALELDVPAGWEIEAWDGDTLVVAPGESGVARLTARVADLGDDVEVSVGARLLEDGALRDQARVYYRKRRQR
jgi:hypothetical protein